MQFEIRRCAGAEVLPWLEEAARLRIAVFREFPYLYRGSEDYERDYLSQYAACPRSVMVLALAGGRVIGVSTGLPLEEADEAFRSPFVARGEEPADWFYFGESVLEPAWRGLGIGHRFFDGREAHARKLGYSRAAFCAVIRAGDHPMKPPGYRPHDEFWEKRGYRRRDGVVAGLAWEQVDSGGREVENELVFWTKEWR